ncbi:MAG: hypothetical protein C0621_06540 [Desulfuromonas sp.]|nr:MAG: hypothetical protein C0621_06540 [Desulfuromonas sp.]
MMTKHCALLWGLFLFLLAGCADEAVFEASQEAAEGVAALTYVEDELLVGIEPTAIATRAAAGEDLAATLIRGAHEMRRYVFPKRPAGAQAAAGEGASTTTLRLKLPPGLSVEEAIAGLSDRSEVLYAEPNYYAHKALTPRDTYFDQQWGLHNTGQTTTGYLASGTAITRIGIAGDDIDAVSAWESTTGSQNIIVATIDSGADLTHPDLVNSLWINPGEIAGNGVDDDGNGYTDDMHGWNFVTSGSPNDDDEDGHGTHVAGIIAAEGDNQLGISGVNWQVRLMPLKFLNALGLGSIADAAEAIYYAVDNGATIINASYTYTGSQTVEQNAIMYAREAGVLVVAAAGNMGVDNDVTPYFPASYTYENIISVAASDPSDKLGTWGGAGSNYGRYSVDLAAPGVNIYSTVRQALTGTGKDRDGVAGYEFMTGTSMASPHVSGAAALVWAAHPDYTAMQVKIALMMTVDKSSEFDEKMVAGGRLNVARAIAYVPDPNSAIPPVAPASVATVLNVDGSVTVSWEDLSANEDGFYIRRQEGTGEFVSIADIWSSDTVTFTDVEAPDGVFLAYDVAAFNGAGTSARSTASTIVTVLKAPTNIRASASTDGSSVVLYWDDNSVRESGMELQRSTDGVNWSPLMELSSSGEYFRDYDVTIGIPYYYRVRALSDTVANSVWSNVTAINLNGQSVSGSADNDSRCFIATAAYGTAWQPQVMTLRSFRDRVLLPTSIGRFAVESYYRLSPPLADFIAESPLLRRGARMVLAPVVWLAEALTPSAEAMATRPQEETTPQELLVRFHPGLSDETIAALLQSEGLSLIKILPRAQVYRVALDGEANLAEVIGRLEKRAEVDYAEENVTVKLDKP